MSPKNCKVEFKPFFFFSFSVLFQFFIKIIKITGFFLARFLLYCFFVFILFYIFFLVNYVIFNFDLTRLLKVYMNTPINSHSTPTIPIPLTPLTEQTEERTNISQRIPHQETQENSVWGHFFSVLQAPTSLISEIGNLTTPIINAISSVMGSIEYQRPEQTLEHKQEKNLIEVPDETISPLSETSHFSILKLIRKRYWKGYLSNGVCHGIALMAEMAFLSGLFSRFRLRWNKFDFLLKIHNQDVGSVVRQLEEEQDFDSLAFLEGIELCMRLDKYPELLEKGVRNQEELGFTQKVFSMIETEALKQKGEVSQVELITGFFCKMDLKDYLSSFVACIDQEPSIDIPIALEIHSALPFFSLQHSIFIGYDPVKKAWSCKDANQRLIEGVNTQAAEDYISEAFFNDFFMNEYNNLFDNYENSIVFTIKINVATNNQEEVDILNQKINRWKEGAVFKRIHEVVIGNTEKNKFLLFEARLWRQSELVEKLCRALLNADEESSYGDLSLLRSAIIQDRSEIAEILIEEGANVNERDPFTHLSLHELAISQDRSEIVKILIRAKANFNERNPSNHLSPLGLALTKGNPEIVKILKDASREERKKEFFGSPFVLE